LEKGGTLYLAFKMQAAPWQSGARAIVAALFQCGTDAQQAAQLAMCTSLRAHRDSMHAREVEQPEGEFVDDLERALHRLLRL
jgi:hypothetical protein